MENSRKKMYDIYHNHQRKLKRRDAKVSDQETQLEKNKQTIQDLQKRSKRAEDKIKDLKGKLDCL